ncbi:MAG: pyridoxal phosphate-dependent aminotransferase [Pseudomonadales bacterium]|nr:pyridoxal phosphate-dependent aminotransferase [Pseudomonadales bacterium]
MNAPIDPLSKLPDVGTTIFTVMSALAAEQKALNLSQGFPDFDGPPALLDRVEAHMRDGRNQYPPMAGVESLRQAIAEKVENLYGLKCRADDEVTVTAGATEALFCAIAAVVHPGDEVIVLDPAYDSYDPVIRLQGGMAVHVPLSTPSFSIDWQRIADAITPRTRLLILNSPHNPTGMVMQDHDIEALSELCSEHDLYLIGDEVYEHMVFDQGKHLSLCAYADLYARSFVISSFGKTYHVTGWKVGYCVAPPRLTLEFRRIHQYVTFTVNTPVQLGIADFLQQHPEHHRELPAFYQRKRDLFCQLLEPSRFSLVPSQGTYFQLLGYSQITAEADDALARRWTCEQGIASIPISVFYQNPQDCDHLALRFCFAKDDATLAQAAEILCRL